MLRLHRLFALVGSLGIMGPHAGHEAELLLAGKKPIGMFCTANPLPGEPCPNDPALIAQIATLDRAVADGRLAKHTVAIPPMETWEGRGGTGHFYCQKGMEKDMIYVAAFHQAIWDGREEQAELLMEPGLCFGYTRADVRLYKRGGYDSLNPLLGFLMKRTHGWRKAARLASMWSAEPVYALCIRRETMEDPSRRLLKPAPSKALQPPQQS